MHLYSPVGVRDRIGTCYSLLIGVVICMRLNSARFRFKAEWRDIDLLLLNTTKIGFYFHLESIEYKRSRFIMGASI